MHRSAVVLLGLIAAVPLAAQDHRHQAGMTHPAAAAAAAAPAESGQSAFAAIAEVVRLLEADSTTDWSRVDLEALRQHLIDMDEVTLRATVTRSEVPGGAAYLVTGRGRTLEAIRRMVPAHAPMLDATAGYRARTEPAPDGVRLIVTAEDPAAPGMVARIRGLGFIGAMTVGAHHGPHHLAIARGLANAHSH
ncbi:MAG: hypothetical protein AB7L66_03760 [Gemmatimonadales bacterium]